LSACGDSASQRLHPAAPQDERRDILVSTLLRAPVAMGFPARLPPIAAWRIFANTPGTARCVMLDKCYRDLAYARCTRAPHFPSRLPVFTPGNCGFYRAAFLDTEDQTLSAGCEPGAIAGAWPNYAGISAGAKELAGRES